MWRDYQDSYQHDAYPKFFLRWDESQMRDGCLYYKVEVDRIGAYTADNTLLWEEYSSTASYDLVMIYNQVPLKTLLQIQMAINHGIQLNEDDRYR